MKLSFVEKAGYSLGDAAANFVFMTMILFQLNFYTDTLGITAAAAGTMLLHQVLGRLACLEHEIVKDAAVPELQSERAIDIALGGVTGLLISTLAS